MIFHNAMLYLAILIYFRIYIAMKTNTLNLKFLAPSACLMVLGLSACENKQTSNYPSFDGAIERVCTDTGGEYYFVASRLMENTRHHYCRFTDATTEQIDRFESEIQSLNIEDASIRYLQPSSSERVTAISPDY